MATQTEAMFKKGVVAYREGAYDQARDICCDLQRLLPDHPAGLGLLGAIELRRNDPIAAIAALSKATSLVPADLGFLSNLGIAHRMAGNLEAARAGRLDFVTALIQKRAPVATHNKRNREAHRITVSQRDSA